MPPLSRPNLFYRFPFLANEIFNCEINALLDRFFDAPEKLLKKTHSVPTPTTDTLKKKDDEESSSDEEENEEAKKGKEGEDEVMKAEETPATDEEQVSDVSFLYKQEKKEE